MSKSTLISVAQSALTVVAVLIVLHYVAPASVKQMTGTV